jgi:hypothetical protein
MSKLASPAPKSFLIPSFQELRLNSRRQTSSLDFTCFKFQEWTGVLGIN